MSASEFAALPALYARWMDELLCAPIPAETAATCGDCAMAPPAGQEAEAFSEYFNPSVKCCTFTPTLPNFLVGAILDDPDPALDRGRRSVITRIEAGLGVTPLGLVPPARYELLYQESGALFGRSSALLCPHFVVKDATCGIWRYREATCTTWYCKHVRGAVGERFWLSLRELLVLTEKALAREALLGLGLDDATLDRFAPQATLGATSPRPPHELEARADPTAHRALWGEWTGRERELYRRCAGRVRALSWREVEALAGPDLRIRARALRLRFAALTSRELPATLRAVPVAIVPVDRLTRRVHSYRKIDALDLPAALVEVLHRFDGRPVREALGIIEREDGLSLDDELVRRLVDFEVLAPMK